MPDLIVIYGAPFTGKTALSWQLGRSLPGKTAIVSTDHLLTGSIPVHDADYEAELEMVHVQLRLLVASYLKNRYHVIVEGAFLYEHEGKLLSYEADIDQLLALMRNMTDRALVVRLTAHDFVLAQRADNTSTTSASRINAAYKARYGARNLSLDTSTGSTADLAAAIEHALAIQHGN